MRVSLEESCLLSEIELVKVRIRQDANILNTMVQQLAALSLACCDIGKENTPPLHGLAVPCDPDEQATDSSTIESIHFIVGGCCTRKMDIDLNDGVIFIDELKLGPLGQRNSIRHHTYTSARHGNCACWIPKGTVLLNIKHHKRLLAEELIVNRLKDLFSKGRCSLS